MILVSAFPSSEGVYAVAGRVVGTRFRVFMGIGMSTARLNGRDLHYTDTGGNGPPILLAHGFFLDHTMWESQASALSPRWRVITWDAPGHGMTEIGSQSFSYWDLARDVLGLMDVLSLRTATVGGLSQGGFIALRTALLAPQRVDGLILADTEARACSESDRASYRELFTALAEHGPTDEITGGLAAQIIGDHPQAAAWREHWQWRELPLGPPVECLLGRDDIAHRLGEITCPALLLWGSEDTSLPRDRMELLRRELPEASEVKVIAGAGHAAPMTHPETVTRLLIDWLSGSAS